MHGQPHIRIKSVTLYATYNHVDTIFTDFNIPLLFLSSLGPGAPQSPSWHEVRPPTGVTFLRNLVQISQLEGYKSGVGSLSQATHRQPMNPLNAKLNPICHLLSLLGAHHILHVSRIRINFETCLSPYRRT